jgi:hypothetical protein
MPKSFYHEGHGGECVCSVLVIELCVLIAEKAERAEAQVSVQKAGANLGHPRASCCMNV